MRARTVVLVLLAVLLVAGAVTAAVQLRGAPDRGRTADPGCNPDRPACQEQQRADRLRAFCAENPRDAKCRA